MDALCVCNVYEGVCVPSLSKHSAQEEPKAKPTHSVARGGMQPLALGKKHPVPLSVLCTALWGDVPLSSWSGGAQIKLLWVATGGGGQHRYDSHSTPTIVALLTYTK